MTGQRIVLKGKTLDEIAARVRSEHGPRARIVAAERVTSGGLGIAGLFSKRYVEATVELPERGRRAAPAKDPARPLTGPDAERAFTPTPAQRVGLAALLADAEEAEEGFAQESASGSSAGTGAPAAAGPPAFAAPEPEPAVSTRSGAFADLMDDLAFNGVAPAITEPSAPAGPAPSDPLFAVPIRPAPTGRGRRAAAAAAGPLAPSLLEGPGDLVVVVGERPDTSATVQAMAEGSSRTRAAVRVAGTCADGRFVAVSDRRGALDARASGVELDRATLVAVGWDSRAADIVRDLAPDQIWVVVDAARKHADTERFVAAVTAVIDADGLAVTGIAETSSPDTVRALGLPVGWADA